MSKDKVPSNVPKKKQQGFQPAGRKDPMPAPDVPTVKGFFPVMDTFEAPKAFQDMHRAWATTKSASTWQNKIGNEKDERTARALAAAKAPAEELETLIESGDRDVLVAAAGNELASSEVLHSITMSADPDDEVLLCKVAGHRNAAKDTLTYLADNSSPKVKTWVAWHERTDGEVLARFRDDRSVLVRQGLTENPNARAQTLFYLGNALYEEDSACRTVAKSNDNYPSATEREAIAVDPKTPLLEREMLAWDTNSKVRKAARSYFGDNRPTADELASSARERGFSDRVAKRVRERKEILENRTAGHTDD